MYTNIKALGYIAKKKGDETNHRLLIKKVYLTKS